MKQKLPEGIENFRMMETNSGAVIQNYLEDNVLIIEHVFPTGNSQIIYQYLLPGWFGSLEMNREFNLSLDKVDVLTPEGYLQIKSEQLTFSDKQSFHDITYLTWKNQDLRLKSVDIYNQQCPCNFAAVFRSFRSGTTFIIYNSSLVFSFPAKQQKKF